MEVFTEEGIVIDKKGDIIEVAVMDRADCKTCAARPFCSPDGQGVYSKLLAIDNLGSLPGDEVVIQVKGSDLLKAVFMVYGLPLFLFIFVIGIIIYLLEDVAGKEAFAFGSAAIVIGFYYLLIKFRGTKAKVKKENLPKTVRIKRSFQSVHH
ncbi:MAG: SoxR reducing system RseC family protein [Ignavibacteriales bacterium]|nr:MAG: SoxR reducing system RseC family protein [Ignavibacteriaceae bacterium]MBW7873521.1 SoxR reducing system RseC family protein [Ignavibacteria bacterium]MCZ2142212.1 SoxR reducing system RseC family protein [Ignavibacteriales bacterium]OQY76103.1 MAG: hypothetical protein B6D45_04590 [Ignavibacteriales bacterium UTCHB3]MBV6444947.1 hypothetical protein [Ignavibacteriaceae bacterium]